MFNNGLGRNVVKLDLTLPQICDIHVHTTGVDWANFCVSNDA